MKLKPCPFCGNTEIESKGHYMWRGGIKPSQLISWAVSHHCKRLPGTVACYIEFRGRERENAEAQWNMRP